MKKVSVYALIVPFFLIFASCGSTENIATVPQTPQEAVNTVHEDVANAIAKEINSASPVEESKSDEKTDEAETPAESTETPEKQGEAESAAPATVESPESVETAQITETTESQESTETEATPEPTVTTETAESFENSEIEASPEPTVTTEPEKSLETSETEATPEPTVTTEPAESLETSETDASPEPTVTAEAEKSLETVETAESLETASSAEQAEPALLSEASQPSESTAAETEPEKVSDEDANLNKERENAPTTDERGKVSEYQIFEEPEVVVFDLQEDTPATEPEIQVEPLAQEPAAEEEKSESPEKEVKLAGNPANTEIPPAQAVSPLVSEAPVKDAETAKPKENKDAEEEKPTESEKEIPQYTASRAVSVKINQYLDVTYPGKGWTYIGETNKEGSFNYFGRKLGTGNTTFSLRAKKAGNTFLHFYKNDALTGEYIDDFLEVTVENQKSTGRVKAPSYADIVPAKPQRRIDRANEALENQNHTEQIQQTAVENPEQKTEVESAQKSQPQKAETASKPEQKAETSQPKAKEQPATEKSSQKAEITTPAKTSASPKKDSAQSKPTETAPSSQSKTESDIKTRIQTTDTSLPVISPAETNVPASPVINTRSETYTPTSTESNPGSSYEEISAEPDVVASVIAKSRAEKNGVKNAADESLLEKAKKDFVDGKFEDALREAQEYYNNSETRLDEALFLLGQISESESSVKDIRFAVDSYDMLVKRFPASRLWKEAKNRSVYLKRFYIDIR